MCWQTTSNTSAAYSTGRQEFDAIAIVHFQHRRKLCNALHVIKKRLANPHEFAPIMPCWRNRAPANVWNCVCECVLFGWASEPGKQFLLLAIKLISGAGIGSYHRTGLCSRSLPMALAICLHRSWNGVFDTEQFGCWKPPYDDGRYSLNLQYAHWWKHLESQTAGPF